MNHSAQDLYITYNRFRAKLEESILQGKPLFELNDPDLQVMMQATYDLAALTDPYRFGAPLGHLIKELNEKLTAAKSNPPAMLFITGELMDEIIAHLAQLHGIDLFLANRDALDATPLRFDKIAKAVNLAASSDPTDSHGRYVKALEAVAKSAEGMAIFFKHMPECSDFGSWDPEDIELYTELRKELDDLKKCKSLSALSKLKR